MVLISTSLGDAITPSGGLKACHLNILTLAGLVTPRIIPKSWAKAAPSVSVPQHSSIVHSRQVWFGSGGWGMYGLASGTGGLLVALFPTWFLLLVLLPPVNSPLVSSVGSVPFPSLPPTSPSTAVSPPLTLSYACDSQRMPPGAHRVSGSWSSLQLPSPPPLPP